MISDSLKNSGNYNNLPAYLEEVFLFLNSHNMEELKDGRIELRGNDISCMISTQNGKRTEEAKLEFHRKYIDLHFTISGSDTIGWKASDDCKEIEQKYDCEKDLGFFSDKPVNWLTLLPGQFAVFFPEDAHAPLVSEGVIRKAIFKIPVNNSF